MSFKDNEEQFYRSLPIVPGLLAFALFVDGVVVGSAWRIGVGLCVVLIASWSPRLRGKVEIALGALKFKGELTTPAKNADDSEPEADEGAGLPPGDGGDDSSD
jgi:hypothetical protein